LLTWAGFPEENAPSDLDTPVEIGTLAQWANATATFLAVLVALFKDEILRWRRKPDLTISAALTPPNCHKTTMTYTDRASAQMYRKVACYYLRIWVENIGKTRAERVQSLRLEVAPTKLKIQNETHAAQKTGR